MFTSIPIGKAIDVMSELLIKSGVALDTTDEFEQLILTCVERNICKFDEKTFRFPGGLPMGGPMSSLIAEVLMDRLERWVLRRWYQFGNVILWYRYVDDVFCIWEGSDNNLQKFQKVLHSFDDNIQFTMEIGGHKINYLDLTISLSCDDLSDGLLYPTFSIYCKPTFSGVSIHGSSWHPVTQKLAVIRSAMNRLLSFPPHSRCRGILDRGDSEYSCH